MLTADLAQSWQRGGRTGPRYIDRSDPNYLRDAAELIRLFTDHEGQPQQELDTRLEEFVGTSTDYKVIRGLVKLLSDRCTFETVSQIDPVEIRRALFRKAARVHPVFEDSTVRHEIMLEAAHELGCLPEVVSNGLYADLPERQQLIAFETLTNSELLDLYNLAQAQAILYRCVEMRLWIEPQSPEGYRELFGAIKAYRLIHTITGNSSQGYEVRLDGPVSMFHRSQKYGVQMSIFLPALLLGSGWRMRAEISLKPGVAGSGGGGKAFFELNSTQQQLRSHYLGAMPYQNPTLDQLRERWQNHQGLWTLDESSEVIDLGGSAFIPDFVLRHSDGEQVYLEVLGFWTPAYLKQRLEEFAHAGIKNFLLAAWDELRGSRETLTKIPPQTIIFKRSLDPAVVELSANNLLTEKGLPPSHPSGPRTQNKG